MLFRHIKFYLLIRMHYFQIPQSLIFSTTESGALVQMKPSDLVVSVYEHAALFPLLPTLDDDATLTGHRSKDYYGRSTKREDMNIEITSPVVGFQLSNLISSFY